MWSQEFLSRGFGSERWDVCWEGTACPCGSLSLSFPAPLCYSKVLGSLAPWVPSGPPRLGSPSGAWL